MAKIECKRVYDPPAREDGLRVLVDRLWPRGLSREKASVDEWMRELGPSDELRKWFAHDPARFSEFKRRYKAELREHRDELRDLAKRAKRERLTLLFAARDAEHNNAVVLAEALRSL
jgi:uncharacterized protein YeaO (DUF488 family)